jgi:hypothetical protein
MSHPDGLAAARAAQTPGLCAFCEERLPEGRKLLCTERDCRLAYLRAYSRDKPGRGVGVQKGPRKGPEVRADAIRLRAEGMGVAVIASELEVSDVTVYRWLRRAS